MYSKLNWKFSGIFSMLSKNRKWSHDLKIAYGVKGYVYVLGPHYVF